MYVGQQDTAQSADIWGKFVSDGSADMWGVETVRGESGAEYEISVIVMVVTQYLAHNG